MREQSTQRRLELRRDPFGKRRKGGPTVPGAADLEVGQELRHGRGPIDLGQRLKPGVKGDAISEIAEPRLDRGEGLRSAQLSEHPNAAGADPPIAILETAQQTLRDLGTEKQQ